MPQDTITISFECKNCGSKSLETEADNPGDNAIVRCKSCLTEICTYGELQAKGLEAAKGEIDRLTKKHLGVKPTWRK